MARLERWEVIERWVFGAVGIASTCGALWLLIFNRSEPGRIAGGLFLIPWSFWVFWQLFHEEKLGTNARVSGAERAMYTGWLWGRRIVLGTVALICGIGALAIAILGGPLAGAAVLGVFALLVGWVALYGGGHVQSFEDDKATHHERARRYE